MPVDVSSVLNVQNTLRIEKMKSLRLGEKISRTIPFICKYGKGELYITNLGLEVEVHSKGIIFQLSYSELGNITFTKSQINLCWFEDKTTRELSLIVSDPKEVDNLIMQQKKAV